jgi:hypothetical protein
VEGDVSDSESMDLQLQRELWLQRHLRWEEGLVYRNGLSLCYIFCSSLHLHIQSIHSTLISLNRLQTFQEQLPKIGFEPISSLTDL